MSETAKGTVADVSKNRRGYTDVQGAPRFPIRLPVAIKATSDFNQSGVAGQGIAGKTVIEKQSRPRIFPRMVFCSAWMPMFQWVRR